MIPYKMPLERLHLILQVLWQSIGDFQEAIFIYIGFADVN